MADRTQPDSNGNRKLADLGDGTYAEALTLGTLIAGEDLTYDVLKVEDRSTYVNLSASAAAKDGAGRLKGIFVASASATPTIKLWDNNSAATTILVNTFTPVGGTFYPFPDVEFVTGLYVTIGGTVDCTVFLK